MSTPVPVDTPRHPAPGSAPTRRYAVLRAVGAAITALLVLAGAGSAMPNLVRTTELLDLGWPAGTTELHIAGGTGEVLVREGDVPVIEVEKTWSFRDPTVDLTTVDGVTSAGLDCSNGAFNRCNGDWTVVVPPGTPVKVSSSVGDVDLRGLTGDVTVTGSLGDVRVNGAPASLDVETSLGSIDARLTQPVRSTRLRASLGDVDLSVPAGQGYATVLRSELGEVKPQVVEDPSSPYRIEVTTSLGDILVKNT